jgi:hypothetical protein
MKQQKRVFAKVAERSPAVLKASIVIALHTVKSVKPHTETEVFVCESCARAECSATAFLIIP